MGRGTGAGWVQRDGRPCRAASSTCEVDENGSCHSTTHPPNTPGSRGGVDGQVTPLHRNGCIALSPGASDGLVAAWRELWRLAGPNRHADPRSPRRMLQQRLS